MHQPEPFGHGPACMLARCSAWFHYGRSCQFFARLASTRVEGTQIAHGPFRAAVCFLFLKSSPFEPFASLFLKTFPEPKSSKPFRAVCFLFLAVCFLFLKSFSLLRGHHFEAKATATNRISFELSHYLQTKATAANRNPSIMATLQDQTTGNKSFTIAFWPPLRNQSNGNKSYILSLVHRSETRPIIF